MISIDNRPTSGRSSDEDFTTEGYRQLLKLARKAFSLADYRAIPWGQRFILWRHDCDYSLNRALVLAKTEAEESFRTTFFLNPHCEFYNLLQSDQLALVKEILLLGHDIGLHFDAAFYATATESELHEQVSCETDLLERFTGIKPAAFSFHNPSAFHLTCEADTYGGLVNCYSRRFKTEVPYCSDSNGYWRFRRLHDVLTKATDPCLQVLTHPGWWQEKPMPPRQRIFRSAYGRARATMSLYDRGLEAHGRENLAGAAQSMRFLKPINPTLFEHCDFLWNAGRIATLFVELWRIHESQINKLCKAVFRREWMVSGREVNALFEHPGLAIDGWRLFNGVFGQSWQMATGTDVSTYNGWVELRNRLVYGRSSASGATLESGCIYLCGIIEALANWGRSQPVGYDGLRPLGSIGIPTCKSVDGDIAERLDEIGEEVSTFSDKRWETFKAGVLKNLAGVAKND